MNPIDLVILGVLGFYLVRGIFRGFFYEVFGLVGVLAALILATKFMSDGAAWINGFLKIAPGLATVVAFLLIFFAVMLVVQLLIQVFQKLFQYSMLGWFEKLSGGAVGVLKGATLVSLVLLFLTVVPYMNRLVPGLEESKLYRPLRNFAPEVFNFLMEVVPNSNSFYGEVKESLDKLSASDLARNTQRFLKSIEDPPKPANDDERSR